MKHNSGGEFLSLARRVVAVHIALAALVWLPGRVQAYQQTMTCTGSGQYACNDGEEPKAVHWSARCVRYRINAAGSPNFDGSSDEIADIDEIRRAVVRSFSAWTEAGCSDMTPVYGGLTDNNKTTFRSGDAKNMNVIAWRDHTWKDVASARAFALTSVTFNPKNGLIADADIDVNTEYYTYSGSQKPPADHVDLQNTLTHEAGHFLGLDHSDLARATMFSTAPVGQTTKRTLDPDDINGLCKTYPSEQATRRQCARESDFPSPEDLQLDDGVCSVAGLGARRPLSGFALVVAAAMGLGLWRRRHWHLGAE